MPDESGRYCYSVWLRHLIKARQNGLVDRSPHTVVELGPGSSLGAGLAALLSGTARLCSLDAVQVAKPSVVLQVFEELTGLFRDGERIPDDNEFPYRPTTILVFATRPPGPTAASWKNSPLT